MAIQTKYEFTLPQGYIDEEGTLHRKGLMKLATAADEILPQEAPKIQNNPAYLDIILFSRVVIKLGSLSDINTGVIEGLFLEDFSYLKEFYQKINSISSKQTEYEFTLPKGYVDEEGTLHRKGLMRLATAADEILPMKDPMVQSNLFILLSRVVIKLGGLGDVNAEVIKGLFVKDLSYLQEFYQRINSDSEMAMKTKCPHCGEEIEASLSLR